MKNTKNCLFYFTRFAFAILIAFFISFVLRLGARVLIKFAGSSNKIVQTIFFDRPDLSGKEIGTGVKVNFEQFFPFGESYEEKKQRLASENVEKVEVGNNSHIVAQKQIENFNASCAVEKSHIVAENAQNIGAVENIQNSGAVENFSNLGAGENAEKSQISVAEKTENINATQKNSKFFSKINKISAKCDKITAKFSSIKKKLETWLNENIICRYFFLEKANWAEKITKWNLNADLYNPVIKLKNGSFSTLQKRLDTDALKKSIVRFANFLQSENVPFIYVQAPYKISPLNTEYAGVRDFSNQNSDDVLSFLSENGVKTFDLRQKLIEQNKNFYEMFYITDHHWKAETGLWATGEIVNEINQISPIFIDKNIYNTENFDFKVYKNALLGSYGKKLTVAKTPAEDFTLITPKKPYNFHFEAYDKTNQLANNDGDFLAMIDVPTLESKQLYFSSPYHAYAYGSCNNFITNNTSPNNYRLLLIGDSFSNVFAPFLALGVKQLDRLDLRYFNGSVETLVKNAEKKYDLCIVMYNPDQYAQTPGFVSHEELFDFR